MKAFASWLVHGAVPMILARLGLGTVYVMLAVHKVLEPIEFLKAVRDYDMFPLDPPYLMNLTVVALPWVEITAALLLIFGFWLRASAVLLLVMTAVFTVAVTVRAFDEMAIQGLPLCEVAFDCGCGQGIVFFCSKFAENVGLCALALLVAVSRSRRFTLEALRRSA